MQDTVDHFGKLDIVVPNAGVSPPPNGVGKWSFFSAFKLPRLTRLHCTVLGDRDVSHWWNTLEVNLLGTLNFVASVFNMHEASLTLLTARIVLR